MPDYTHPTPLEIQRRHDQLWSIVYGDLPVRMDPQEMVVMKAQLHVLCWILGHDEGEELEKNFQHLDRQFKEHGITETMMPVPFTEQNPLRDG